MSTRTTYRIPLTPVLGSRFQPTGFPDLGPATFQKPTAQGWVPALHVESPHSSDLSLPGCRICESSGPTDRS